MVGPSGSGKSTLLNLLAQIDRPTEGTIRFRGEEISTPKKELLEPGWRRNIGYVTQQDNLLPWRRLEENVLFPLIVQGRVDDAGRRRVAELIEATGLKGFERYYPHQLSGGMRKRAALARTLVYDPPFILMDEPFGALDAQTRLQLHEDLLQLWKARRKTILFVTHDITEAITLADRVLVLCRSPARVIAEHIIDLPRPRDPHRLVTQQRFAALYAEIHEHFA
jgi:NitT/TauT family transport system ATP-binding protein